MRPYFCLSIGRSAALLARKAAFRLVCSTTSQSASLIRITKVSRVSPALLTRMSSRPNSFTAASTATPGAPESAKSACIAMAWPPARETSSTKLSASALRLRYVIATFTPAAANSVAAARPMPRLPPVTSATWSAKRSAGMRGLEVGGHAGHVLDIVDHRARENLLDQPGQRPPRANLNVGVDPELLQPLDRLGPADRAGELPDHEPAHLARFLVDLRIGIEDLGPAQRFEPDLLPGGGKYPGGAGHQWRMERPAYRQPHQALGPRGLQLRARGVQTRLAPGDHHLPGGVVVGDDDQAAAGGADLLHGAIGKPEHGDHSAGRWGSRRHRRSACTDGCQRIKRVQRRSRHQAGKLAHAVAGEGLRFNSVGEQLPHQG